MDLHFYSNRIRKILFMTMLAAAVGVPIIHQTKAQTSVAENAFAGGNSKAGKAARSSDSPQVEWTEAPLPSGLLPAQIPEFAKWTVTITNRPEAGNPIPGVHPSMRENRKREKASQTIVTVVKTFPNRKVTIASPEGDSFTMWCFVDCQVRQTPNSGKPILFNPSSGAYLDYSATDFPELAWISKENFVGTQMMGERTLLVFNGKSSRWSGAIPTRQDSSSSSGTDGQDSAAYLDAMTRLPVSMQKGTTFYDYKFERQPTTSLVPPADIKAMVEVEEARLKQLGRRPPGGLSFPP